MALEFLDEESLINLLKPIYPTKKENWKRAYYVGLRPNTVQRFKSKELLKIYVYSDIEWYYSEHDFLPLVTSMEYFANFLRISDEELKEILDILEKEDAIIIKQVDETFYALWPKY